MSEHRHVDSALGYEAAVIRRKQPACRWIQLACDRTARDRRRKPSATWPYRFDAAEAERVCQALELFPHVKAPHARPLLDGQGGAVRDAKGRLIWSPLQLAPWQCWITANLFGWRHVDSGYRRYNKGVILVPRKNGKTTWMAAIANYLLAADGEEGAEVYSAATTRDQARIVFRISQRMIRLSPEYRDFFGVLVQAHDIVMPETDSRYQALSADANTLDGLNPSGCVVDEFQAHQTRGVWDVITTATGSRAQPMVVAIGTAGEDTAGICYEQVEYIQRVLDGTFEDEHMFGVIYGIDESDEKRKRQGDDDWKSPLTWQKANPNYGVSVRPEYLMDAAQRARNSPQALAAFRTKHLNVWTTSASPWLSIEDIDACTAA